MTSWDTGKTDHIGVFDTGNNSRIRHHKSIVLEIVDFSVVSKSTLFSPSANIFKRVIFLGMFSLSLECM